TTGERPGRRLLDAAEAHGIDLTNIWGSVTPDNNVRHVCLLTPGPGRVAMAFTDEPEDPAAEAELGRVIATACRELADSSRVRLVQALLEPRETHALESFLHAGFLRIGGLMYMRRPWRDVKGREEDDAPWPDGVTVDRWRQGEDAELVEALQRTYIDTLDCPELCGMRDGRDVLESHRASGQFDPNLWWLVRLNGEAHGALLLNPDPTQGHTELVYLGLSPALRGKHLGGRLLRMGLRAIAKRREREVTCAVDERNVAARRLYEKHGFQAFARRIALVRSLVENH
ncbi:MAG: GNAT family N-acetyltransferase, partial [Planctomycetota bacterium]|nr:GNAT family N-acetyltransferase [Planctomycetota bacterium]